MRRIAVLDAPSNLGLRPPTPSSVPGCAKAPGALRDHGLIARLSARDAGCHTPPRFDPGGWLPGDGVSQAREIARYSVRLADRIGEIIDADEFALVLGGDCSIAIGSALAISRLGDEIGQRMGMVYIDAHSDFRHPGNARVVGAAAGEALALVTGRGQTELAGIEQRRPYVLDTDVAVVGLRPTDDYRMDLQAGVLAFRTVPDLRSEGATRTAAWCRNQLAGCGGFWVHLDTDVLDPSVMPAVDAPAPGGIAYPELEQLLRGLVSSPDCLGLEVTVFDPDFDPDGVYAGDLVSALVAGLAPLATTRAEPPSRLEPSRIEPSRPAPSRAEPPFRAGARPRDPRALPADDPADLPADDPLDISLGEPEPAIPTPRRPRTRAPRPKEADAPY